jgi:hypothetical protein
VSLLIPVRPGRYSCEAGPPHKPGRGTQLRVEFALDYVLPLGF